MDTILSEPLSWDWEVLATTPTSYWYQVCGLEYSTCGNIARLGNGLCPQRWYQVEKCSDTLEIFHYSEKITLEILLVRSGLLCDQTGVGRSGHNWSHFSSPQSQLE